MGIITTSAGAHVAGLSSIVGGMVAGIAVEASISDQKTRDHVTTGLLVGTPVSYQVVKRLIARDIPVSRWLVLADESIVTTRKLGFPSYARLAGAVAVFALGGAFIGASMVNQSNFGHPRLAS